MPDPSKWRCSFCGHNRCVKTTDNDAGVYESWMKRQRECTYCGQIVLTNEEEIEVLQVGKLPANHRPRVMERQTKMF